MVNPVKNADTIDWDKIAKRLGHAFDEAMRHAEASEEYGDTDFRDNLKAACAAAEALTRVTAEARAARETAARAPFVITKPVS